MATLIGYSEMIQNKQLEKLKRMILKVLDFTCLSYPKTVIFEGDTFPILSPVFVEWHTEPVSELDEGGFHFIIHKTEYGQEDISIRPVFSNPGCEIFQLEDILFLLTEFVFPNQFVFWENESQCLSKRIIPALQWLHKIFPQEDFLLILGRRMDSLRLRHICSRASCNLENFFEYYKNICIKPAPEIMAECICKLSQESLDNSDTDPFFTNNLTLDQLDEKYSILDDCDMRMSLFIVILYREIRKHFWHGDKNKLHWLYQAVQALNYLRNGGNSSIDWNDYEMPTGVIHQLRTVPAETLIPILDAVFRVGQETIAQVIRDKFFGRSEQSRKEAFTAINMAFLEKQCRLAEKSPVVELFSSKHKKIERYQESIPSVWEVCSLYQEFLSAGYQTERKTVLKDGLTFLRDHLRECVTMETFEYLTENIEDDKVFAIILAMKHFLAPNNPFYSRSRAYALLYTLENPDLGE